MDKQFFNRDAEIVAKELLGKIIIVNIDGVEKIGKIVETEAYFGNEDPASRACQNGDLRDTMMMKAGTILVYGVHNNWLINFVTGDEGSAAAVLIRAVEPLNFEGNCRGPGLLTKALGINKSLHKSNILNHQKIRIKKSENLGSFKISRSFRVGVKKDLEKPLRFYIEGNKYVSGR